MTFHDFITTKYPLYVNEMKVNLTVSQLCELVEEWEKMTEVCQLGICEQIDCDCNNVKNIKKPRKTFKERLNEELQKKCSLCGSDVLYTTSKQKYCKCGWEG